MKVGDRIYIQPRYSNRAGHEAVIEKVGRKWIHISGGRKIEKGGGSDVYTADGAFDVGTAYESRAAYEAIEAHWVAWTATKFALLNFLRTTSTSDAEKIPIEKMRAALEAFGLKAAELDQAAREGGRSA